MSSSIFDSSKFNVLQLLLLNDDDDDEEQEEVGSFVAEEGIGLYSALVGGWWVGGIGRITCLLSRIDEWKVGTKTMNDEDGKTMFGLRVYLDNVFAAIGTIVIE